MKTLLVPEGFLLTGGGFGRHDFGHEHTAVAGAVALFKQETARRGAAGGPKKQLARVDGGHHGVVRKVRRS